jgi:hypothetical protein
VAERSYGGDGEHYGGDREHYGGDGTELRSNRD